MRAPTPFVAALLFGSGMAALVYQTAWQRIFRLVFGASTAASAAVLGIFLGGLGLGGVWLGRRAERSERPLFFYGNLEIGVALSTAVTPLTASAASWVYLHLGGSATLGEAGATVVRLGLATLVMGPAVVLMGGTLPAAARAVESDDDAARRRLATLYAVNTGGAVTGALLGTFLLFEVFGTRLALWLAVLVNLLVALVARMVGRTAEKVEVYEEGQVALERDAEVDAAPMPKDEPSDERPSPDRDEAPAPRSVLYASAGIVGFAFLAAELVWYRMLAPILGGSTFTFGLILAVALLGIGAGGWIYSRRSAERPATLSLLALTVGLEALAMSYPLALGDSLAFFAAAVREVDALGFGALSVGWFLVAAVVLLPASLVSGYQFPVLFALLGRGRRGVARHVGVAYAFNTVGSIVGSIITGFVLVPMLGAVATWRGIAGLLAVLALVLSGLCLKERARRIWTPIAVATGVALVAVAFTASEGPTAAWRHSAIGAGRLVASTFDRNEYRALRAERNHFLFAQYDGVESAVGINDSDGYSFIVNGKADGSVVVDRATQTMAGLLPAMLHPNPKSAFVLGLGTGMTAGWLGKVASIEQVDVAELEGAILEVARLCSAVNHAVLEQPNVHVFRGDGREFLLTSDRKYDVIASEPSNPYRAGIASLFTREFYELVDRRLADGGIFGQWTQGYEIDAATVRIVVTTLRSVFPHVEAWVLGDGDFLFVASREGRTYDVALLEQRARSEPYRSGLLRAFHVEGALGVLSHFIAANDFLEAVAQTPRAPVNTDDMNHLEFAFARTVGSDKDDTLLELWKLAQEHGAHRPPVRGAVDWEKVSALRTRVALLDGRPGTEPLVPRSKKALKQGLAVEAGCVGDVARVWKLWTAQPDTKVSDYVEAFAVGEGAAHQGDDRALTLAGGLRKAGLVAEAELVTARYYAITEDAPRAVEALERGVAHLRKDGLSICATPRKTLELLTKVAQKSPGLATRGARALMAGPLAVHRQEMHRIWSAQTLAHAAKDPKLCLESLGTSIERPAWTRDVLVRRAECLEWAGHPLAERALSDVREFDAATIGRFAVP